MSDIQKDKPLKIAKNSDCNFISFSFSFSSLTYYLFYLNDKYQKTNRLRLLCPEVLKYDMPIVDVLINGVKDAESEIQSNEDLPEIIGLLKSLENGTEINVEEAIHNIDKDALTKLNQLGVINVPILFVKISYL